MAEEKKYTNVLFLVERNLKNRFYDALRREGIDKNQAVDEMIKTWVRGKKTGCSSCGADFDIVKNQCSACDYVIPF